METHRGIKGVLECNIPHQEHVSGSSKDQLPVTNPHFQTFTQPQIWTKRNQILRVGSIKAIKDRLSGEKEPEDGKPLAHTVFL